MPWGHWAGSVALTFLAGWVLIESVKARRGLPANGAVAGVAKGHPHAGSGLMLVIFIAACVVAWMGNSWFDGEPLKYTGVASETATDRYSARAILDLLTLLLGLATFAHILDYEYGGKFNPVFPLMFLGPAIAGALQIFGSFSAFGDNSLGALLSLAGSITVAAGGCMAAYTMYESLKEAKRHGDEKRAQMLEARKAGRQSTRRTPPKGEGEGNGEGGGEGGGDGGGEGEAGGGTGGARRPGGAGRPAGPAGGTPRRPRA
jgi:hypothetical protein